MHTAVDLVEHVGYFVGSWQFAGPACRYGVVVHDDQYARESSEPVELFYFEPVISGWVKVDDLRFFGGQSIDLGTQLDHFIVDERRCAVSE